MAPSILGANTDGPAGILAGYRPEKTGWAGVLGSDAVLLAGLGLLGKQGSFQRAMQGYAAGAQSDEQKRRQAREDAKQQREDLARLVMAQAVSKPGPYADNPWTNPDAPQMGGLTGNPISDAAPPAIRGILGSMALSGDTKDIVGLLSPKMESMARGGAASKAVNVTNPDTGDQYRGVQGPDGRVLIPGPDGNPTEAPPGFLVSSAYNPTSQQNADTSQFRATTSARQGDQRLGIAGRNADANQARASAYKPLTRTIFDEATGQPRVVQWDKDGKSWVPVGGVKSAHASGGITTAQQRVNAEVDAARQELNGMSRDDVLRQAQQLDPRGLPNPEYNPYTASLVRRATSRKTGDDPEFEGVYHSFYSADGAPPQGPQRQMPARQSATTGAKVPRPAGARDADLYGQARQAIQSGKDPAAVAQRLREWGLDPAQVQ